MIEALGTRHCGVAKRLAWSGARCRTGSPREPRALAPIFTDARGPFLSRERVGSLASRAARILARVASAGARSPSALRLTCVAALWSLARHQRTRPHLTRPATRPASRDTRDLDTARLHPGSRHARPAGQDDLRTRSRGHTGSPRPTILQLPSSATRRRFLASDGKALRCIDKKPPGHVQASSSQESRTAR
jgi:hypothetical protein